MQQAGQKAGQAQAAISAQHSAAAPRPPTHHCSTSEKHPEPLTHFHAQAAQATDQDVSSGHAPHALLAIHRQLWRGKEGGSNRARPSVAARCRQRWLCAAAELTARCVACFQPQPNLACLQILAYLQQLPCFGGACSASIPSQSSAGPKPHLA